MQLSEDDRDKRGASRELREYAEVGVESLLSMKIYYPLIFPYMMHPESFHAPHHLLGLYFESVSEFLDCFLHM